MHSLKQYVKSMFFYTEKPPPVVGVIGFSGAGKTTMLYKLQDENAARSPQVEHLIPTVGFHVEALDVRSSIDVNLMSYTCGGRDPIRALKRHFLQQVDAILYVVDSSPSFFDLDWDDVKNELHRTLDDKAFEEREVPVTVLCNKQDVPAAIGVEKVASIFRSPETSVTFSYGLTHAQFVEKMERSRFVGTTLKGENMLEQVKDIIEELVTRDKKALAAKKDAAEAEVKEAKEAKALLKDKCETSSTQNSVRDTLRRKVSASKGLPQQIFSLLL